MHDQGLADALRVESVAGPAALDERPAEQFRQRVTDNKIVQISYRLGQAGPRCVLALSQVLVRNMEMDEVARRAKLGGQWLRRARDVQRSRGHQPVEYGVWAPRELEARGLQGDANHVAGGGRHGLLVAAGKPGIEPSGNPKVQTRCSLSCVF